MTAAFTGKALRAAETAGRGATVALAFSIPISTALDNILMGAVFLAVLASNARAVGKAIAHNAAARAGMLLFVLLALGLLWGAAPLKTGIAVLGKYADLALMPFMLVALRDEILRRRAMQVFLVVMAVTAVLSWLVGLSILPVSSWMWEGCRPDNPAIFRSSITQNVLMAYAVYLALLRARDVPALSRRWGMWVALAALMGADVLFMVQGRTGYVVLLALLVLHALRGMQARAEARGRRLNVRILVAAVLSVPAVLVALYFAAPRLHDRVDKAVAELRSWTPGVHTSTSIGERLEFYSTTAALIERHPVAGYGTGGFAEAYEAQARSMGLPPTGNPHNEYLLITVQLGLLGLLSMLYLFLTQWRFAARLPAAHERNAAQGLMLTLALTSLFNSPLVDHTEGLFYAFMSAYWFARLKQGSGDA